MLRKTMLDVIQRAGQAHALKKITAGYQLLPASPELGISYILWIADASHNKPKSVESSEAKFRDPFAQENLEHDLFVAQLHGTHYLILNKFSVVDEHLVLPTVEFFPQEQPLDVADFRAIWTAMQGLDAFAFFNCGFESGASQPHKHMQLITYSSMKEIAGQHMPPLLYFIDQKLCVYPTTEAVQLPELPFHHYLHRIDSVTDNEKAVAEIVVIYNKIISQMNSEEFAKSDSRADAALTPTSLPVAYNLLLTSSFLYIIPRKARSYKDIEVNSIAFAGSFFARNHKQRVFFEADGGPFELLRQVTFPPKHR